MLGFTGLGFFLLLNLDAVPTISFDTDLFYRCGASGLMALARGPLLASRNRFRWVGHA
jgi:hypothetical protein